MSAVLDRIAEYWLAKSDSKFLTPRKMFSKDDECLIDNGVFRVAKEELHSIRCPFGCGDTEPITLLPRADGSVERFVSCSNGEGEMVLAPEQYQLMEFVSEAFLRYCGGRVRAPEKHRQRKLKRPRGTNWILKERALVLDYANDPKRNPSNRQPYELCHTVWRINEKEFEAAARLPKGQRGYKNTNSLRAYFYREYQCKAAQLLAPLLED